MAQETFTLTAPDGLDVACYRWLPPSEPKAVVQISHGMGEHAQRYQYFSERLVEAGYAVYADDHRGHGATIQGVPGYMGEDGWNRTIEDAAMITDHIEATHAERPIVFFGHSMGAMLGHEYLCRYGERLTAAVLSGSPGMSRALTAWLATLLGRIQRWRHGPKRHSSLLQSLVFEGSNKAFDTIGASGFEWLSRDTDQVARYLADAKCGFVLTAGSMADMFDGVRQSRDPAKIRAIPKHLPIYILSGTADPVHKNQVNLNRLLDRYRDAGLSTTVKLYPDGRHEMLNEINRDEVMADTIGWLNEHVPSAQTAPS